MEKKQTRPRRKGPVIRESDEPEKVFRLVGITVRGREEYFNGDVEIVEVKPGFSFHIATYRVINPAPQVKRTLAEVLASIPDSAQEVLREYYDCVSGKTAYSSVSKKSGVDEDTLKDMFCKDLKPKQEIRLL